MVFRLIVCVALIPGVVEAAQPEAADQCAQRMRAIAESARAYEKDKGRLPAHLSDLVPDYLKDVAALQCPADRVGGLPYLPFFPPEWRLTDPKLPVSYYYMRAETPCPHLFTSLSPVRLPDGATVRQRMEVHRVNFGETIPLLHCNHHTPAFRQAVMVDGTIHRGGPLFEYDAYVYPVVLERLHADAANPALLRKNWWLPAVEQYLTPWLATPLSPAVRQRLFLVGELVAAADHPVDQRAAAFTLAARCYDAGGDVAKALAAAEKAAAADGENVFVRFLVDDLKHRAAGSATDAPVESLVRAEMARRHVPGVAFAVLREGKPVVMKSMGFADVEKGLPLRDDSLFRIASPTKSFVACAVMLLSEEGKLSLDDSIAKHLAGAPAAWEPIKIRHLLSHTGGLADIWDVPADERPTTASSEALVRLVARQPLRFAPGTRHEYNKGAVLLGPVIEKVTGRPWGDFLKERLFRPAGMTGTRVDDAAGAIPARVSSYSWDDVRGMHSNVAPLAPGMASLADGGMLSSISDLARWDAALYRDEPVKQSILKQMWTPFVLNDGTAASYGYGWQMGTLHGHAWVGHSGAGGSSSKILRFPQHRLSVIVLANLDRNDASPIADAIAGYYLPPPPAVEDAEPALAQRVRQAIESLAEGRADGSLPVEGLAASRDVALAPGFYKRLGRITAIAPRLTAASGRAYAVAFEGGVVLRHTVETGPDARINAIRIEREPGRFAP